MSINSQFSVSVHILTYLAKFPATPVSSAMIAESVGTNPALIRKLMGRLTLAKLIKVERGREGGASLNLAPKKITLRRGYLSVMNDPLHRIHSNGNPRCPVGKKSYLILTAEFGKIEQKYLKALDGQTIEGLVKLF